MTGFFVVVGLASRPLPPARPRGGPHPLFTDMSADVVHGVTPEQQVVFGMKEGCPLESSVSKVRTAVDLALLSKMRSV